MKEKLEAKGHVISENKVGENIVVVGNKVSTGGGQKYFGIYTTNRQNREGRDGV